MALAIGWVAKNLGFWEGSEEPVLGAREGFLEAGETSQALKGNAPVGHRCRESVEGFGESRKPVSSKERGCCCNIGGAFPSKKTHQRVQQSFSNPLI